MSKNNDEEAPQVYYIPANYDDSGGVFGGRIGTRNAVELAVFCGPIAYLEYKFLRFSIQTNLIIALITILPIAFLCVFGVGGETLSQLIFALARYVRGKRILHYDMFTPSCNKDQKKFSLDRFLDIASSSGIKAAIAKFQEERENSGPKSEKGRDVSVSGKAKRGFLSRRKASEADDGIKEMKEDLRRQEREIKGQTKGWLSAARKDKGHRAFNNPSAKK